MGVGGAALITSGVLFYLGWDTEEEVSASITPTGSGMMLQVGLRR